MKTVKVRKFKKEGSLLVRDTDGQLLTFLADSEHTMTALFFQRPLGISLLRDNELEFVNPKDHMELQPETVEVPVIEQLEAQVETDTEQTEQLIETVEVAELTEESAKELEVEQVVEKPKQDKKKINKKEAGG